jgi:hypothetical protein
MRGILIGGICAAALCALVGAPAASAAEPAFFECAKVIGGKFKNASCTKEGGKGGHELVEGVGSKPVKFKPVTTVDPFAPSISGGKLNCTGAKTVSGTLASPTRIANLVITSTGCVGVGSKRCNNKGNKSGTVVTNPLEGTLGAIDAEEHRVGLLLKGEAGADMEDYNCEGAEEAVFGAAIGELTPVGVASGETTLSFTRDGEGLQALTSFEGGPTEVPSLSINGSPFPASIAATITIRAPKLVLKG